MRYLFIHCVEGINRTPATAAGYFKFVAQDLQNPPQIVVIEGGFNGFAEAQGSGDCEFSIISRFRLANHAWLRPYGLDTLDINFS